MEKNPNHKIVMLTAYDYPTARILDRAGIDVILVGDSLANVVLGLEATHQIGIDVMLHHARAVCRGVEKAVVIADMPASSMCAMADVQADKMAGTGAGQYMSDAKALIEAGCDAVKVEWSENCLEAVSIMIQSGIPVMGHVGLTPQTAQEMKVQGRDAASAQRILQQARMLQDAGCFALVLECVPEALAKEITGMLKIPTIGIGAGRFCDGQVLVLHDMLGLNDRKVPKFVKKFADISSVMAEAVLLYREEVSSGKFPGPEHTFH
ncbi:MAG: 3-methyl-2-oxobutanoate hydroxymethyltransferase [Candidatus Omnitrophota bacterium]